jgi:hypothetical protein
MSYYSPDPTPPSVYNNTWEYCDDGSFPQLQEDNGTYVRDCGTSECIADNQFCGNGIFNVSSEECDRTQNCIYAYLPNGCSCAI